MSFRCLSLTMALMLAAAGHLAAQPGASQPRWEMLMQKPVPEDSILNIHIVSLPLQPAPAVPRPAGTGHSHAGPVFGYVVNGNVEIQVDPDPPAQFKAGEVFYEAPKHVHRLTRNLSMTEPASIIAYQVGYEGGAAAAIKVLHHDDLAVVAHQEVRLLRLTLPPGAVVDLPSHRNPDAICVLDGRVDVVSPSANGTYGPTEFFARPVTSAAFGLRNSSATEAVRVLVYQVVDEGTSSPVN